MFEEYKYMVGELNAKLKGNSVMDRHHKEITVSRLIDNSSQTLEQALKNTLPQTERVDILTAYFYFSGFSLLAEELKDKHIRILVG